MHKWHQQVVKDFIHLEKKIDFLMNKILQLLLQQAACNFVFIFSSGFMSKQNLSVAAANCSHKLV